MPEEIRGVRRLSLPSVLHMAHQAEAMIEEVSKWASLSGDEEECVCMAVMEAVVNAIVHGNREDPQKHVDLEFDIQPERISITVRDQGVGFDPGQVPDPRAPENLLKPSGRGILMIRSCMDEVEILPSGAGTEVRMIKRRRAS